MHWINGFFGGLGAGKSTWATNRILWLKKYYPWCPVAASTPMILPGPGSFFLLRSMAHYIAFGIVVAQFCRSPLALLLSETISAKWSRRGQRPPIDPTLFFLAMQAEYERIASEVDWKNRHALDDLIAIHNERVLTNTLAPTAVDALADVLDSKSELFKRIDYILDPEARFEYAPPRIRSIMFIDEAGIVTGSTDNAALKNSSVYLFLANLRRFGIYILYTTHGAENVWVQMRRITDMYYRLVSFEAFGGRTTLAFGFKNPEDMDEFRHLRGFDFGYTPYGDMGRSSTFYIVSTPEGLS